MNTDRTRNLQTYLSARFIKLLAKYLNNAVQSRSSAECNKSNVTNLVERLNELLKNINFKHSERFLYQHSKVPI